MPMPSEGQTHELSEVNLPSESERETTATKPYDDRERIELQKAGLSNGTSSSTSPCQSENGEGERILVSFSDGDLLNPYNFSRPKKIFIVIACALLVMNSTIGSSIASGVADPTQEHFGITNGSLLVLPISIYLVGYVIGPLVFAVRS